MKTFIRTKFDSLDGKTIVAFTTDDDAFQLRSNKSELILKGELSIDSEADLQAFAKLMADAWTEHRRLKPKLQTTLSGH